MEQLSVKDQQQMYRMVVEIYHHLGLDGQHTSPILMEQQIRDKVAKHKEKYRKKNEQKISRTNKKRIEVSN